MPSATRSRAFAAPRACHGGRGFEGVDELRTVSRCHGYAVLRGEKAPDDALARELGAMGLL